MRDIKSFLKTLSHHPGVYQMLGDKGEVLYVGKAKDLKKRVSSYFRGSKDPKTASLVKHIKNIDITVTSSENEAVILECNLIKAHKPRYNILLRDDKSYPYIHISNHKYPRIDIYRGRRKKDGLYFGPYPSALAVREAIDLLQKIFNLRTCLDSYYQSRTRPCLLHQIGRCSGPCVGLISEDDYAENVKMAVMFLEGKSSIIIEALQKRMELASHAKKYEVAATFRDQIGRLRQLQDKQYAATAQGHADVVACIMQSGIACAHVLSVRNGEVLGSRHYFPILPAHSDIAEILSAFIKQRYLATQDHAQIPKEIILNQTLADQGLIVDVLAAVAKHKVKIIVPEQGDKKKWLDMAMASANQALSAKLYSKMNLKTRMLALKDLLGLKKQPNRIECFDISHSMGEATVASCVVFDANGPVKSDYRRFNIEGVTPGDDVAAMRQVLMRRFKKINSRDANMPDLVFIDGGKTQLSAAVAVMAELGVSRVFVLGVSKGPGRKPGYESIHIPGQKPMHLAPDSPALHFIQQVRDEAHRFAITGHRARRDKVRTKSVLESIPGVGALRRRELLRFFGGIQGVAHASLDELKKVPGISNEIAGRIFAAFHDTAR